MKTRIVFIEERYYPMYLKRTFFGWEKWEYFWYFYGDDFLLGLDPIRRSFDTKLSAEMFIEDIERTKENKPVKYVH